MQSVKRIKRVYMFYSIALILLGTALLFAPELSAVTLCSLAGAVTVVCGVVKLCGYFVNDTYGLAFQFDFALGIFAVAVGIILLMRPQRLLAFVNVIIGLFLLAESTFKLQTAKEARQFGLERWWAILILGTVTAVLGILLICNPLNGALALTALLGLALMADGFQNLLVAMYTIRLVKRFSPINDEDREGYHLF